MQADPVQANGMPANGLPPMGQLPAMQEAPSACISVANLPGDMSRRELSHIFRPFQGFMVRARSALNPRP